ncbi:MAG: metallophosphoesterase [Planctomycetes bacterium]|nr:metallophosphoesterase [Planctomycetota bacterium]
MASPGDLDRLLSAVKDAARALKSNPHRRGNLIVFPPAGEVMITGDLHGDRAAFDRIVRIADLENNPGRHLILQELVHGFDSPDGECGSCALIEAAAVLVTRFPDRVHVLMGNHEMAELTGRVIMKGSVVLNELFRNALARRYGERAGEALAYYAGFWRVLPLAARTANRVFISHSTPSRKFLGDFDTGIFDRLVEEEDLGREGSVYALLWGRDFSRETAERLREMLDADFFVVGHTPCPEGFQAPNDTHVIIDSQGEAGKYLFLPLEGPLTCEAIVSRIRPVWP